MKRGTLALATVGTTLAAFAAGAAAAWVMSGAAWMRTGVGPGPWKTNAGTGDATAGPLHRALVSRTGLWALPQSEVVYFRALTDDDGRPLSRACVYEIAGRGDPPTRWWSINLYRDHFWVDNPTDRYSYSRTTVARAGDGSWRVRVAADPQPGDWLPMGDQDGLFLLSFRLYQPAPSVAAAPQETPLPGVRRISCA
ncbi:DUF1214 domain-containing protein [Phenylobacterium sp. SCN 70-31]|uniref:DUF1214 domain-containing protein n=1 Tax=Phenylobacterium sp. SCN 70-31 TaxID=1660129 RepID=UPI00086C2693|nr:DUF1214 domain-containing protein [Phenylobacterium sp. SCN 70-31]ODT86127.1 MAG: hypothetical protein ABS78_17490 [Phenylobacterium sp. SCN 70-31]